MTAKRKKNPKNPNGSEKTKKTRMQKPKNDPKMKTETPPSDHVGERCFFSVVRQAAVPCRPKLTAKEAFPREKRYRPCGRKMPAPASPVFRRPGGARPVFPAAVRPGDICTPVFRRLCKRGMYTSRYSGGRDGSAVRGAVPRTVSYSLRRRENGQRLSRRVPSHSRSVPDPRRRLLRRKSADPCSIR